MYFYFCSFLYLCISINFLTYYISSFYLLACFFNFFYL